MPVTESLLPGVQQSVPLADKTTFRIGGPAEYYYDAKTPAEFIAAHRWAQAAGLPITILGGGSNMLVNSDGVAGLVIHDSNVSFQAEGTTIRSGSGVSLSYFVDQCIEHGLAGAEGLVGIPGSVGGAVRGNAGAWGQSMGDLVTRVTIFDGTQERQLTQADCGFRYRTSLIKQEGWIVLEVECQLMRGNAEEMRTTAAGYLAERARKHPTEPSAGSVFQNILLEKIGDPERVRQGLGLSAEEYAAATVHGKLAVGFVIDRLDLRGTKIGQAQISLKHGNILVNLGGATSSDVLALLSLMKQRVRDTLGIQLEEEVQCIGF